MSEINCHGEITSCPWIEPATPGLQIWCFTYWANQAELIRVSKSGNIHNRLLKLIKQPFSINHWLLIKCIFMQMSAYFLTNMILFPVMHMLVFLCYLLHVQYTCICIFIWPVLSEYDSKICFLNDKKQVFILKFYWSDVPFIIDYVKYNRTSKIMHHFDQFSIIIDDRWNTRHN